MLCLTFCLFGAWAIDGDTLGFTDLSGERLSLRLWGVNAPEKRTPEGPKATEALSDLIEGQMLECDITNVGSYGRFVGQCWLPDGTDLGCELIKAGFVEELEFYSKGHYRDC